MTAPQFNRVVVSTCWNAKKKYDKIKKNKKKESAGEGQAKSETEKKEEQPIDDVRKKKKLRIADFVLRNTKKE